MSARLERLWNVALQSLERFYLAQSGLLARSVAWDGREWTRDGTAPGDTAAGALALSTARAQGMEVPLDPDTLLDAAIQAIANDGKSDDVAMTVWAEAVRGGPRLGGLIDQLATHLERGSTHTMTLAWSLIALCECAARHHDEARTTSLARKVCATLLRSQVARTGLFLGSQRRHGLLRRLDTVAALPSQTYTIYGLARFGEVFNDGDVLTRAAHCADTLCRLQGSAGQWWFRYDTETCAVQQDYPVYSVNQHTAIPLAFATLQRVLRTQAFDPNISAGYDWLFGANECSRSLVDERAGVTWRGIERSEDGFRVMPLVLSYEPARCVFTMATLGLVPQMCEPAR